MHRSPTLILVVLVALLVAVPGTVAAPYSLGTSNDVSVPDQTVSAAIIPAKPKAPGSWRRRPAYTASVPVTTADTPSRPT